MDAMQVVTTLFVAESHPVGTIFGIVLPFLSTFNLVLLVNWVGGGILDFTFFYAVVYTMWLKRSTPQNIAIGGAVDTFPHVRRYSGAPCGC